MHKLSTRFLAALALILTATGCSKCTGSYSGNFNGKISSHLRTDTSRNGQRTLTERRDGVKRTLETNTAVQFQDGKIMDHPQGAVITLTETQGERTTEAELRENAGQSELWVKKGEAFEPAEHADKVWLDAFMHALKP